MKIRNLGHQNSIINQYIAELRNLEIQKDRMRFRRNVERVGELMAYEISKELEFQPAKIETPLGVKDVPILKNQPVIASILRAGLPLHQGILNVFDQAENAFISAFRKHTTEEEFIIQLDYVSTPDLNNKVLILADPMLATAQSMVNVFKQLLQFGKPKHTHIVSVISSQNGLDYLVESLENMDITVWTAALDEGLSVKSYIVPGLGDAGDLAYGEKI